MRYSSIVLDLDGTLVDTTRALTCALNETLAAHDRRLLAGPQVRRHADHGLRALLRSAFHLTGAALSDSELNAALNQFRARYDHWLLGESHLQDGVLSALQDLQACGARLSVLTNKPTKPTLKLIEHFGLEPHLDYVVAGDMGLPHKPDPAGLLLLLDQMHCNPEQAVFVGSSRVDMHTARNAEVRSALSAPGLSRAKLLAIGADYVLDHINQLLPLATGQLPSATYAI